MVAAFFEEFLHFVCGVNEGGLLFFWVFFSGEKLVWVSKFELPSFLNFIFIWFWLWDAYFFKMSTLGVRNEKDFYFYWHYVMNKSFWF